MINLDDLLWFAQEGQKVIEKVAPLIGTILGVDSAKVEGFLLFLKDAKDTVLKAIELFLKAPAVFGCDKPDCDCPDEYSEVLFAIKAQEA